MKISFTKVAKNKICPNCHNQVVVQTGKEQHTPAHVIANSIVKCNVTNTSVSLTKLMTPEQREAQKTAAHNKYKNMRWSTLKKFNHQFSIN